MKDLIKLSDYNIRLIMSRCRRILSDVEALSEDIEQISQEYVINSLGLNCPEILDTISDLEVSS